MTTVIEQLKDALAKHDWYYAHSDDYGVYCKGAANADKIKILRHQAVAVGVGAQAEEIYAAAIEKFKNGPRY